MAMKKRKKTFRYINRAGNRKKQPICHRENKTPNVFPGREWYGEGMSVMGLTEMERILLNG